MQSAQNNQLLQQLLANQEVEITSSHRRAFFQFYADAADDNDDALATDAIKAAKKHGFNVDTDENKKLASLYYCMRKSWGKIVDADPSQGEFYSNEEAKEHITNHLTRVKAMFLHLIGSEAKAVEEAKAAFFSELERLKGNPDENFENEIKAAKQTYRQRINSSSQTDQKQGTGRQSGQDQAEKNKKLQIEMMNAIAYEYMFACATLRATKDGGCVARYKGKVQVLTLSLDEVKNRYDGAQVKVTDAADLKTRAQNCLDSRRPADALEDTGLREKIKAIFNALAGTDPNNSAWEQLPGDKKVTFARHALQLISGRYRFKLENKDGSYCAKVVSKSWFSLKRDASGDIFAQMYNVVMDHQPRSIEQLKKDEALEHVQNNRFGGAAARNKAHAQKDRDGMPANAPPSVMQGGGVEAEAAQAQMEAARAAQAAAAPKP